MPTGVRFESRYEYVDDDGVRQAAVERGQFLVKRLAFTRPG
jgi:hypothetical protein